jgi:hypothetical protein
MEPLILQRFGLRAWGGIGLCAATVLTLGLLSTNPLVLQAGNISSTSNSDDSHSSQSQNPSHVSRSPDSAIDPQALSDPESAERSRMDSENARAARDRTNASDSDHASLAGSNQAGSGAGRTNDASDTPRDLAGSGKASGQTIGERATGGGENAAKAAHGDAPSGIAGDSSTHALPPPWTTQDWSRAKQHAADQLHSGDIPDAYRDLVRDYFSH